MGARLAYWIPTVLVVLVMGSGGAFDAMRTERALQVFRELGYPVYFATLLGAAKVLGAIALVAPVPRTIREWAYAGLTFDVLAAMASLLAVGHPISGLGFPVLALILLALSYIGWRRRSTSSPEEGPRVLSRLSIGQ